MKVDNPENDANKSMQTLLMLNEYPYHLEKDISHYLLWRVVPMAFEEVDKYIENDKILSKCDILWYINPIWIKSIKGVWHCHILARTKS